MQVQHLENIINTIAIAVVIIAGIAGTVYAHVSTTKVKGELMAKDIATAIERGIDPMVVRCAYANSSDTICIVHTTSKGNHPKVDLLVK